MEERNVWYQLGKGDGKRQALTSAGEAGIDRNRPDNHLQLQLRGRDQLKALASTRKVVAKCRRPGDHCQGYVDDKCFGCVWKVGPQDANSKKVDEGDAISKAESALNDDVRDDIVKAPIPHVKPTFSDDINETLVLYAKPVLEGVLSESPDRVGDIYGNGEIYGSDDETDNFYVDNNVCDDVYEAPKPRVESAIINGVLTLHAKSPQRKVKVLRPTLVKK